MPKPSYSGFHMGKHGKLCVGMPFVVKCFRGTFQSCVKKRGKDPLIPSWGKFVLGGLKRSKMARMREPIVIW
jgi:hypothetical protein